MESEVTPVLRNNPCSRLFKRVFIVKTAEQKLKAPVLLPQLENVIAAWGKSVTCTPLHNFYERLGNASAPAG
jgi:hypothetical protein